jgi:hypothetical protein
MFVSSNSDLIIVAASEGTLPPADWSVTKFPAFARDLQHFDPLTAETLEATIVASRSTLHPYLGRNAVVNSDFHPVLDLNGERLRFRNLFADGFREIAEARFDIPAALEGRRRPFGTVLDNPASEIVRASALSRGAHIRAARAYGSEEITSDSVLRAAAARVTDFDRSLSAAAAPDDWNAWLDAFAAAEEDLHGGTAGVADEDFYSHARKFLRMAKAPAGPVAAVDLYHGLAAWEVQEAARAGDVLIAQLEGGARWIPTEVLRRGTAVARLRLGDATGAARIYASPVTMAGGWSLPDVVLQAYIDHALSPGGASSARAPLPH